MESTDKAVESAIIGSYVEMETEGKPKPMKTRLSKLFWHGGSVYDAWFSCASNQVAQVLLTLPYSFSQLGMASDKRTWTYIFGACCATTVFIPSFHNYRIWSFLGLIMTTYTAWYLTIASLVHGQVEGVKHSGPTQLVLYFTGATNVLYTFGGHAVTVEIMHAMWKPQKFKAIYLVATLYVLTLTLPSAASVYWAFGDLLLNHSNAFSLLPKTPFRDMAVILMLFHQFTTFGFASMPLYFVWEKAIGMHECRSICKRALARLPVVIPIWFLAIVFPFFGPINSAVGSLLVSFTVYIIPALAHMLTFRCAHARENAVERPPSFVGRWAGMYSINIFIVGWVLVVGFGFGGWASMTNFVHQIDTFGLFTKCFQCPPTSISATLSPPSPLHNATLTLSPHYHKPQSP
ncbi:hypothetical protein MRB53_033227 [Persea americana]|uniref:Uncharacterized protein n=1 Tax=Persea americana TaxID=3435 RepID=A0ACC2KUC5_PERAE|nr:hypothetical protein MRB53_033227 [Persea americana]